MGPQVVGAVQRKLGQLHWFSTVINRITKVQERGGPVEPIMLAFLSWSCPCLLIFSLFYFRSYSHRKSQKYFSGPPAEPLLGHLRVFPQNFPWVTLAAWAKQYGMSMNLISESYYDIQCLFNRGYHVPFHFRKVNYCSE